MKIKVSQEQLHKGIQTISSVIPNKATLPVLSHILLEAKDGALRMAGTDLEIGISCTVPAEVTDEGATTVPAKRFGDLVKELPKGELLISTRKNNQTTIECPQGLFKVLGLPKEEFPRIYADKDKEAVSMDQGVLEAMLNLTTFAVSHDESRYVLNGLLFIVKGGDIRFVATDGRRLASIERKCKSISKGEHRAIVPLKAVSELRRLLQEGQAAEISIKESQAVFDLGNTQLITRLIEGKFPDFERVIPDESPQKLTISKDTLLSAARRISLWATQESPSIRFDLKANNLVVSKQTPEVGDAHEELKAKYSGEEFSVGFNPDYLIDVLKALPDGDVAIELPGPDRPGVIRTKDQYLYIVLPMQLNA
ncbi:MAG: DNA polymerase III subunit beta [Candidatus Omnitrophica bacterium CG11_big_fil_rev_8_21_14_0_20_64_10]|nr:MAG: DNA polymerase III subunit beta [Candidatus Omnitrophica bacterium CG11_big_fil_rev_8_21_14_0_20_64_10]